MVEENSLETQFMTSSNVILRQEVVIKFRYNLTMDNEHYKGI